MYLKAKNSPYTSRVSSPNYVFFNPFLYKNNYLQFDIGKAFDNLCLINKGQVLR